MEGREKISRFIEYGLLSLYASIAISVLIKPDGLWQNYGLSYYGLYRTTIIPFALGFLLCGVFVTKAVKLLATTSPVLEFSSRVMSLLLVLMVGVLLTPDIFHPYTYVLHTAIAGSLFFFQLAFSVWLDYQIKSDVLIPFFIGVEVVSGIIAFLSVIKFLHILLLGQVIFQFAFAVILVRSLRILLGTLHPIQWPKIHSTKGGHHLQHP